MRTRFYKDESKDDFQKTKTSISVTVNGDYVYLPKNIFFRIFSFWLYYFVAFPILTIFNWLSLVKVKGRKKLRELKGKSYFLYANHTNYTDAWLAPVTVSPFRRSYIVANKDAIQIPFIRILTKALGALPVADTMSGMKNMSKAIEKIASKKQIIAIFPEAHIWNYYTSLRPFPITSFKFPALTNTPIVPVAVCYKKRLLFGNKRKPKQAVFIGEPIYPKHDLTEKQNAEYLRNSVCEYIKLMLYKESTYSYYNYVKLNDEKQDVEIKEEIV